MLGRSRWIVAVALILVSSSVYAQRGGGRGRMGRVLSPVELIGSDAVQKELALSEDQKGKVKVISEEFRAKLQEAGSDFRGLRDLPDEERREQLTKLRAKMTEAIGKLNAEYKPKIAAVLDATQMDRLQQIARQAAGTMALEDPDVLKELQLTKEQQEKIDGVFKEHAKQRAELFGGGAGNARERIEKVRDLDKTREKEVKEILTTEQKDQLEKMRGKPFDVMQLRVSGSNRPRRGPRGERSERPANPDASEAEKPSGEKPEDPSK